MGWRCAAAVAVLPLAPTHSLPAGTAKTARTSYEGTGELVIDANGKDHSFTR